MNYGLVAHWRMNSGSATPQIAAHGAVNLSSSATQDVGKIDFSHHLNGATDQCWISGGGITAFVPGDTNFAITGWVNFDVLTNGDPILYCGDAGGASNIAYLLFYDSGTGGLKFSVSVDGVTYATTVASGVTLSIATWYFFAAHHDATNNRIGISVNGETIVTAAHSGGTRTGANVYNYGLRRDTSNFLDGLLDALSFWSRTLLQSEVASLYNAGAGLDYPYPFDAPVIPVDPLAVFQRAIAKPTAKIVTLLEMTAGIWFRNWVIDTTYTNAAKVATTREITAVRWNRDTLLTRVDNPRMVDTTAGSWHWDKTSLWVRPPEDTTIRQRTRIALGKWFWWRNPSSTSIFAGTVQAIASFWFSNVPKILNNRFYDPRLTRAPGLSQRIEPTFGGIVQIGGGSITLANADGFFNTMQDYQWDAGSVALKIGVDLPGEDMAWENYQTFASWTPESWNRDPDEFSIRLTEARNRLKTKLPFIFYGRDSYPNIEDSSVGKPIPIAYGKCYGIQPRVIDTGSKKFKIASHAIREFSAVRISGGREQSNTRIIAASSWLLYSGTVYRYYLADEETRNVLFNTTSLTKVNAVTDCVSTAGSWTTEENFTYVNPSGGQTISSGTYTLQSAKTVTAWATANFATVNADVGEFTMGADWAIGTELSVDIIGKRNSAGTYIENAVDVIQDLLTTVGETNLNAASFTTARARLKVGTGENGNEAFNRVVGLYLSEAVEVEEAIKKILRCIGAYLYTDAVGQVSIGVFQPTPGESLPQITDTDEMDFGEDTDNKDNASKVNVQWARREQDAYSQLFTREAVALQYIHNQAQSVVKEDDKNVLTEEADVRAYADRFLCLDLSPLKLYRVSVAWMGMTWKPGDQFRVRLTRRGVDEVMELIEVKIDLAAKRCALTFGNLRCVKDTAGFWVDDAALLPTYLSTLTGYGSGAIAWKKNWHADIKTWARQNVGYWTDANGFADSTDPDSFIASAWI